MKKGDIFTAEYTTSVFKPNINGWREEWVLATFEALSEKMAVVKDATLDRAGSNRQWFNVEGIKQREVGKHKRISSLRIKEEEDD